MSDKYPKVLQVHMTELQHDWLREVAHRTKVSMMECVRGWIDEKCVVPNVGKVERKQTVVKSEPVVSVPVPSVGKLVLCADCGQIITGEWVYNSQRKPLHQACAKKSAGVK